MLIALLTLKLTDFARSAAKVITLHECMQGWFCQLHEIMQEAQEQEDGG